MGHVALLALRRLPAFCGIALVCGCGADVVGGSATTDTTPVAAQSSAGLGPTMYYVPGWLPEDLVVRSRSTSMPCGVQTATTSPPAPCSDVVNMTTFGRLQDAQRAVTIAVLRPSATVTTNTPVVVTVRGKPGVWDQFEQNQGPVEQWILSWAENDTTVVALNSLGMTQAEVLRIANSLETVTKAVWDAVELVEASTFSFPDPSTGVERARLTTDRGEVVQLVEGRDRSWSCVVRSGAGAGCGGNGGYPIAPIDERPDEPWIASRSAAANFASYVIIMPKDFPDRFTVRDGAGRAMNFALSDDHRRVLIVDTATATAATAPKGRFDFVAPNGTVIATAI